VVRRRWATFAGRRRRSRPSIPEEWRELICRLVKENAGWAYPRLTGELRKLDLEISAGTIRRVSRPPTGDTRSAIVTLK
jgi:hypothetical protein